MQGRQVTTLPPPSAAAELNEIVVVGIVPTELPPRSLLDLNGCPVLPANTLEPPLAHIVVQPPPVRACSLQATLGRV